MRKFRLTKAMVIVATLLSTNAMAQDKVQIPFWNSMTGPLQTSLQDIVKEFNQSQDKYQVTSVPKGSYSDTLTATIASVRSHTSPVLAQVYDAGTVTMMIAGKNVVYPVNELFKNAGQQLDKKDFIPATLSYYSNGEGQLMSMPFNSSTPVLYYNKDWFKKAGIKHAPSTWQEYQQDAEKLVKVPNAPQCGATSSWFMWTMFESFSAIQNIPYGNHENGFSGLSTQLLPKPNYFIKQITMLNNMSKSHAFQYKGRDEAPTRYFQNGKCGMLMTSSGSYTDIKDTSKFNLGVTTLPYWPSAVGNKPYRSIIGGASIWALKGHSQAQYKGAAAFLKFLVSDKIQAQWAKETGYITVTKSAEQYLEKTGYFKTHPGAKVAYKQLSDDRASAPADNNNTRGMHLGFNPEIRATGYNAIESMFQGNLTPKQAVEKLQSKGTAILQQFKSINS
ncbi:extracellular solute-binding protein [Vibrio profundum]|uniref:extracellular solute-binding protein n=1 Tax=Vibrio profundum TaxID=2910247 RepID=UPI003D0ED420